VCASSTPKSLPQDPPYNNTSVNDQREHAYRLAEYLQRKTTYTLQVSAVEIDLNSHSGSDKVVLLKRILKLIGSCLDDVISWAKAIPGAVYLHHTDYRFSSCS